MSRDIKYAIIAEVKTHDPYPRYPIPWQRVQGFAGTGTGWPGIPQGYPCYSLVTQQGYVLNIGGRE